MAPIIKLRIILHQKDENQQKNTLSTTLLRPKTKKAHLFHPNFIQQSSSVSIALINQFQFTVQSKASCQIQIGAYSTSAAPNANLKLFAFTLDD